jgi:hypothetical protein
MMIVLVCGGREYNDPANLYQVLDSLNSLHPFTQIIHGAARGADRLASDWARSRKINVRAFPALWVQHGLSAGPIRNRKMLREGHPDLIVAFPGGNGTEDTVNAARKAGVPVIRTAR